MAQFKDSKDRTWIIKLDGPRIRDVQHTFDINLADKKARWLEKVDDDPLLLIDILWVLCRKQATELSPSVTDVDFGESLVGDPIEEATKALKEAYIDFFPKQRKALLREIAAEEEALEKEAIDRALKKLKDPATRQAQLDAYEKGLDQAFEQRLKLLSNAIDSPASSE